MAPQSPEAIARKRQRGRQWHVDHPRERLIPHKAEGADDQWLVLICCDCSGLFDVPRDRTGRLPVRCPGGCP